MPDSALYLSEAESPDRAAVDAWPGMTLLEFGTGWCGHCRAAQPAIAEWLSSVRADLRHVRIEDGPGRALGRSFRVKLWPTLILLRQGQELARVVRPVSPLDLATPLDPLFPA